MAKRKKMSNREKKEAEKAKEYKSICSTLNIKKITKKYGLKKTLWAMKRFVRLQSNLAELTRDKQRLEEKLAEIDKTEKQIAKVAI